MSHISFSKKAFAIAALVVATGAQADVLPGPILTQNFDNVSGMPGWIMTNAAAPAGSTWFQGYAGQVNAQSGPADSYIAANYVTSADSNGHIDLWLITPEITMGMNTMLSFFTQTADAGFFDALEVRYSAGSGTDTAGFTTLLNSIGAGGSYPTSWEQVSAQLGSSFAGTGRFAFRYTGSYADADFIGIDTLSITAVPEPSTYALLGLGLAGLALSRRKQPRV